MNLVLENVAGQGTTIGARFEELARIIEQVEAPERCAVCLDTLCRGLRPAYRGGMGGDVAGVR